MKLYEKENNVIKVYELKELKDKLFEYKRNILENIDKNKLVYKILSNNSDEIMSFLGSNNYVVSKFIQKENKFFSHKNGLKLENYNYLWENKVIIDGLLYQIMNENMFLLKPINLSDSKILLPTTYDLKVCKDGKRFDRDYYKYELPNLVSIPENIYYLNKLICGDWFDLVDKDIEEQIGLFRFVDQPVAKIDVETLNYLKNASMDEYLFGDGLEVSQNILKKVRNVNK